MGYEPRERVAEPRTLRVGTFNIRFDGLDDEQWVWADRREIVRDAILAESPHIVGLQEVTTWDGMDILASRQIPDLDALLSPHGYSLAGASPPDSIASSNPILYRSDLLEVVDTGVLFFKRDPLVPPEGTMGTISARFARWVRFRPRDPIPADANGTGAELPQQEFVVVNAHYNPIRFRNRLQATNVLRDYLPEIAGEGPCIVVGDLNAFPGWRSVRRLREGLNLIDVSSVHGVSGGTLHRGQESFRWGRIDYVLASKHFASQDAWISQVRPEGRFPTDHFAVYADLSL